MDRRRFLGGLGAAALALPAAHAVKAAPAAPSASAATATTAVRRGRLPRLTLAGPPSNVSYPLIRMVASGALSGLADKVEFVSWRDPDRLRALALQGGAELVAMPVNVAANLHSRGAALRLLDVSAWNMLRVVTRDPAAKTIEHLRGKELAMPFRGDMPDLLFTLIAAKAGLDPRRDLKLNYAATPIDAMQLLLTRRVDHALLAEPAVSMALRLSGSFPVKVVAPTLHRGPDPQQDWGRAFGRAPRIPQAGIVVMGAALKDAALSEQLARAHSEAAAWCNANAAACGRMVADEITLLTANAVADSIAACPLRSTPAAVAREELDFLFARMFERSPGLIGGRMPSDAFYGGAA
jgi:NitT/TauT family transport system substrate-binding protein